MRSIGITDFLNRKFDTHPFAGAWLDSFGEPEKNFRAIVYGKPGNGKTEFCLQWAKYLAGFTKTYFNSFEQGISKTLQDALRRNRMVEVAGRITFGNQESFDEMMTRLASKNGPMVVFIDSRDYINLTANQFKTLIDTYPRKAFILICWEANGKPKGEHGKSIEFMCDIKIHVSQFVAHPRSRFGGNKNFIIWDRKPKVGEQLSLLNAA